jgi:site-specific DNA-methyltransferase (adenine-specific)
MKPRKEIIGPCELTREDCMRLMARYPDKYFDLAIVDPPYGNNTDVEKGTRYAKKHVPKGKKWDVPPGVEYFNELFRVSKNQIVWGGNFFPFLPLKRGWVCWYKGSGVKGRNFSEFELAWTSCDGASRHYTQEPFIKGGRRIHPTQKPVALYKYLLPNYAKPGWKILDTHLGSGSSAIACYDMGFSLTACEIDRDYFAAACGRLRLFAAQGTLDFGGETLRLKDTNHQEAP